MNCKQGDLAVYFGTQQHLLGRITRCVRLVLHLYGPAWVVDPPLAGAERNPYCFFDSSLRPIRDNDGDDETLQWAGKPQRVMEECDVQG